MMTPLFLCTSGATLITITHWRVLLTDSVPKEKLCSMQPTCVNHNVSFVVNLDSLDDYNDLRADETGVWKRKGSPIAIVSVHTRSQTPAKIARRRKMKSFPHYYKLSRTYYNHSCSPDFHKIITTVYGKLHYVEMIPDVDTCNVWAKYSILAR